MQPTLHGETRKSLPRGPRRRAPPPPRPPSRAADARACAFAEASGSGASFDGPPQQPPPQQQGPPGQQPSAAVVELNEIIASEEFGRFCEFCQAQMGQAAGAFDASKMAQTFLENRHRKNLQQVSARYEGAQREQQAELHQLLEPVRERKGKSNVAELHVQTNRLLARHAARHKSMWREKDRLDAVFTEQKAHLEGLQQQQAAMAAQQQQQQAQQLQVQRMRMMQGAMMMQGQMMQGQQTMMQMQAAAAQQMMAQQGGMMPDGWPPGMGGGMGGMAGAGAMGGGCAPSMAAADSGAAAGGSGHISPPAPPPAEEPTVMYVSPIEVGAIYGNNGRTLARLESEAGVKVDIKPEDAGRTPVCLSGSAAACERAQVLIRRLINSDPDPWRGGDGDGARGGGGDRAPPSDAYRTSSGGGGGGGGGGGMWLEVRQLPDGLRDFPRDLQAEFGRYGEVVRANLSQPPGTGRILFAEGRHAHRAKEAMDRRYVYEGRPLKIYVDSREPVPPRGPVPPREPPRGPVPPRGPPPPPPRYGGYGGYGR